jgi:hypothetical protein
MRDQRAGLSIHEYTRDVRLPNWGRWGRQDSGKPDNERGCSSIYQRGRADKQGEQTTEDGLLTNADEDAPNPINEQDAERSVIKHTKGMGRYATVRGSSRIPSSPDRRVDGRNEESKVESRGM